MLGITLSQVQILDSSKLKEFADNNFEFDENGRKLSKRVGNTVGKGEVARYEQFLLFPQCFQKTCTADIQGPGLPQERDNATQRSIMAPFARAWLISGMRPFIDLPVSLQTSCII